MGGLVLLGLVQQVVWLTGRLCCGSWQASRLPLLMTLLQGDASSSCARAQRISSGMHDLKTYLEAILRADAEPQQPENGLRV